MHLPRHLPAAAPSARTAPAFTLLPIAAALLLGSAAPAALAIEMSERLAPTAARPAAETAAPGAPAQDAAPAAPAAAAGAAGPADKDEAGRSEAPADGKGDAKAAAPVRVRYLSDTQKQAIRDELREEILDTARRENWAQPDAVPVWVRRTRFEGDFNLRGEADLYDRLNNNQFINFNEANRSGPINVTPPPSGQPIALPILNTSEDRNVLRLRAKLGFGYAVSDELDFNLRLSTGNTVNPVSNNQTLGTSFNKGAAVIDRAYVRYTPASWISADLGRAGNPYTTGTDLVWDRDLGFDGIGLTLRQRWNTHRLLRLSTGLYSVENTDPNYPASSLIKQPSHDKWLWGTQLDFRSDLLGKQRVRAALSYYDFINAEGKASAPCFAPTTAVACDTDNTRPGFMQKGNTLFALRTLDLVEPDDPQFQYFGLASPFRVLAVAASWDAPLAGAVRLGLDVDAARNLAFDRQHIVAREPVNNFGDCVSGSTCNAGYDIGQNALQLQLRAGHAVLRQRHDWQIGFGYRYVESDALPDAYTDSEFHLGGTNAKGYYGSLSYGVAKSASLSARYYAATEVSGPRLSIDVAQLDFSVRF